MKLEEWLRLEPFTLAMSSGFFGFFAHCGFLKALDEAGLAPQAISGSSAGGMAGAAFAAGLSPDALRDVLFRTRRQDFWDPGFGFGLLRGARMQRVLEEILPVASIEACKIPVSISVFDVKSRSTEVVERGNLATAIRATCAVPAMFQPVWLSVKGENPRPKLDGGILDRPGLAGVPVGTRTLYHHLGSRSPWRTSKQVAPVTRENQITLVFEALPRVGPFKLEVGQAAYVSALEKTRRALQHMVSPIVRVS
jgi:NTE family protein